MLLLASTSDLLRVVTTTTAAIDVHVSWVDLSGTTVTPGRTNTASIVTATTTTIVASPAASTYRTVKKISIRNRGAVSNTVTILHSDGTNILELVKYTLAAEEGLHYDEAIGFVWFGMSTMPGSVTLRLDADVANANASANTIADVTGLTFPVILNKLYFFEFFVIYTAAATTTGSRWSVNGPATTYLQYSSEYSLTTTTTTLNPLLTAYDLPAASNATSAATTQNWAKVEGVVQPSSSGTLALRFASEVTVSAITAKIGSFCRYQQISV